MESEQILGRKEDVKEILEKLGIKEGELPKEDRPESFPRRIIDFAVDFGESKGQEDWINYFNDNGKIMASAPDLYYAGKSDDKGVLEKFNKFFSREHDMVTSTTMIYDERTDHANIVHYFKSEVVQPMEKTVMVPPHLTRYRPCMLNEFLGKADGLEFIQALFATDDSKEVIAYTLEQLVGCPADKIDVCAPIWAITPVLFCGYPDTLSFGSIGKQMGCFGRACLVV